MQNTLTPNGRSKWQGKSNYVISAVHPVALEQQKYSGGPISIYAILTLLKSYSIRYSSMYRHIHYILHTLHFHHGIKSSHFELHSFISSIPFLTSVGTQLMYYAAGFLCIYTSCGIWVKNPEWITASFTGPDWMQFILVRSDSWWILIWLVV